jgi:hypothetical protein
MARFSQAFLQGLLQPTYQQGLFEAARGLGQTPGVMRMQREDEKRQKGILGGTLALEQMAAEGQIDEQMLKDYAGSMRGLGVETTDILATTAAARETSKVAVKENALADLQTSITELMDPETTSERASEIKASALSQGRAARVDEARLRAALDAADKRRVGSFLENETRIINELNIKAKQAISRGQSKEAFVAANGEQYGYIYDDEVATQALRDEQLRKAEENRKLGTFSYTDEELKNLGLTDAQINNVKNLKVGGQGKNNAVFNYVQANAKTAPNASLINVYAKAFEAEIAEKNNLDFDDTDDYREIQSLAAKKALEVFSTQGLEGITNATVESQKDEDPNEIDVDAFMQSIMAELGVAD